MPVRFRTASRALGPVATRRLPAAVAALFRDQPFAGLENELEAFVITGELLDGATADGQGVRLWRLHGAKIVAEWAARHPGTRPSIWWTLDAPRQPAGRHKGWIWDGRLVEPRKRLGGVGRPAHEVDATFPEYRLGIPVHWATISAKSPPKFESQAAYLQRHGLLLPREEKRLGKADFKPELVTQ